MISAILLAAGESRRMGNLKQLMCVKDRTILGRSIDALLHAQIDEVVLVLGYKYREILDALDIADARIKIVINKNYGGGMGASIRVAMRELSLSSEAVLVALGDKPFIKVSTVNEVVEAFRNTGRNIIVPVYNGSYGHPVLFSSKYFFDLTTLSGDKGACPIIESNRKEVLEIETSDEGVVIDIDTRDEFLDLEKRFSLNGGMTWTNHL